MKKILIILFIIQSFSILNISYATEEILNEQQEKYGITDFLNKSSEYLEEIDLNDFFKTSLTGKFDNNKLLKLISKLFSKNLKNALLTLSGIIIIVVIGSLLKAISENLGNETISKISYYIQYILIVTLIMTNFSNAIVEVKNAISDLSSFAKLLIPLLTSLMIASGNIVSSGMLEPILLLIITFVSSFITNIVIPIILIATALSIISKISDQVQVGKLSKFMKKSTVWVLTTVLSFFISIASLEGNLTSSLDGFTKKTGKSVVSAVVPVVGSILGDALDTISGYSNIIKNGTGIVGILVVLGICLKPIINLLAFTITYYLGGALIEPIADKKIVELFDIMGGTFKVLLGIVASVSVMLTIGLAIVIRISS